MKKTYRVKRNIDFQAINKQKTSVASRQFVLYYAKNDFNHYRAGVSVSKKLGKAVERNKIKRQVREMIYEIFEDQESSDYIVIVRNGYLNKSFDENKRDLAKLRKKVISNQ